MNGGIAYPHARAKLVNSSELVTTQPYVSLPALLHRWHGSRVSLRPAHAAFLLGMVTAMTTSRLSATVVPICPHSAAEAIPARS